MRYGLATSASNTSTSDERNADRHHPVENLPQPRHPGHGSHAPRVVRGARRAAATTRSTACLSGPGTSPSPVWKRFQAAAGLPRRARSPRHAFEVGDRVTVRRLPATRRIVSLATRSASAGIDPRGASRSWTIDVRDRADVADLREQRDVALARAVDHRDRLLVGVEAERLEDEREHELLGAPFDEQHGAREEDLGALGVELADEPERSLLRERLRLRERRAGALVVPDEHELLEPVDAEEDRGVRRVEDLVASARGEPPQQAVQVALGRWRQVELGLFDQHDEVLDARLDQAGDRPHERKPSVAGRLVADDPDRSLRGGLRVGDQGRGAQVGGEEERVRCALAVQVQGRGRPSVEKQRPRADDGLDVHARVAPRDVLAGRHRRGGFEQRPDGCEHRRLCRTRTRRRGRRCGRARESRRARRDSPGS